jgi:hypothetical protein
MKGLLKIAQKLNGIQILKIKTRKTKVGTQK